MKVLVTGSSASLAHALLPQLCADPAITEITGIDLRPPHFVHPKFQTLQADIRDRRIGELLPAHDALVHLAYVVLRGRLRAEAMHGINVGASLQLLQAAQAAGLKRIVHLSSAAVYGSGSALDEQSALAPLQGFLYGMHKAELEQQFARTVPECVRLRPHVILGPHAQPVLRQILDLPLCLRLDEPQPELQCVHEDDVAAAIVASLQQDVSGPYNLAARDCWTLRAVMRGRHAHCLPLPPGIARAGLALAHGISGWGGEPGWLEGLRHTLTLDCRRAEQELGWKPAQSSAQALAATGGGNRKNSSAV
ncbi:MAG: NAD-dependent epimerase/dehydratase family protein [Burkholderiales bacterium]|nr:NAD-dependent epimerase/dehydratase family protein [Burkholderiales bacterium]